MAFGDQSAKYSCTALMGTNKVGKLKCDEDGYYTMVVGALNVFNSAQAYYPLDTGKKLFEESSSFMRRVREGNCKGEMGHPKRLPGQSMRDYVQRIMSIEETTVCCHFRSFYLEEGKLLDESGNPVVAIMAEVKPAGPMGPALKESLENVDENVCFSIRSMTNDVRSPSGVIFKNLKTIVTFDCVTEPGISVAKKYHAPSLEGLEEEIVLPEHIDSLERKQSLGGASMEHGAIDINTIRDDLGWVKESRPSSKFPASSNW